MAEDCELWDIICDGPFVPVKVLDEFPLLIKNNKEYTEVDKKAVKKNLCAQKILLYGLGPKEYDKISTCDTANEIWKALQIAHEGTTQVKQDKPNTGDSSMMAVEVEEIGYDSTLAFMAQSDDDEDNGNEEVNLAEDRDSLFLELEESEHTREDLVTAFTDQKKTIKILRKEKSDLLAETANQREKIIKPLTKSKLESSERGKEIVSEEYLRLEAEVEALRYRMCAEIEKNELLHANLEKGIVKGRGQQWHMDSGCSKHMTGNTTNFLLLKALQGGSVSFDNGKKGYILGVGKFGKSLTHSIENVYYVNGLKYSLLSVSQICDKGNKVEFLSKICTITNLVDPYRLTVGLHICDVGPVFVKG
ncbi:uncharacterized protein [Nicotiana sylvestris]|uniref:uncharacterized protein n=1 Tax=Nicotiana sylvestris TaxID=4096 RepID=UPI00388CD373